MNRRIISASLSVIMALNTVTLLPANVFAAAGDSHVYEKHGYTVTYKIGNEWDNNRSVTVTLKNTGEESILNWALKYDVGGELYNLWNSAVYSKDEDGTIIKNNGYNYEIEPGQSADFGYIVTGEETLIPEDIELCSRRIDVKSGYEVDFNITNDWYTGFQAEVSIENTSNEPIEAWTLLFEGNFDINNVWNAKLLSSEDRSYEVANQLWTTPIKAGESASFGFTANKSATENAKAENFQLTAVIVGESALEKDPFDPDDDIDYELDTDEDGLPDYYEDILGTDKNKADSDGDGLLDGYEYFTLGTDPLKKDTDDNGVSDANEDFDEDELTNIEEYELGTDPFIKDTDYDGLSDYDEVKIHNTDPLKYDTDGDNVSDGDEAELGLNPLNPATNGYPDNEYTTEQSLGTDSTVFDYINTVENNPYTISVDFTAAGVAENNLSVGESGYSSAIENSAIIGIAPEFSYRDGLSVEEMTIKFNLDNSVINNTLGTYAENNDGFKGINRLNIFTFIEGINMLLPVETFYDEVTNTVYTKTDKMGTYCLMDMEIFFQNLGIEPSGTAEVEVSEAMSEISTYSLSSMNIKSAGANITGYRNDFDVVFIIDEVNNSSEDLDNIKSKIIDLASEVWDRSHNAVITIIAINGRNTVDGFFPYKVGNMDKEKNMSKLKEVLESISVKQPITYVNVSKAVDYISDEYKNRNVYCFVFFDSNKNYYQNNKGGKATLLEIKNKGRNNINISVVSNLEPNVNTSTYAAMMFGVTGGLNFNKDISDEKFLKRVLNHIYGDVPVYPMCILSTNWQQVKLAAPITKKYMELSKKNIEDLSVSDLQGCADTDYDGLYDFQEIMFEYNGNAMMKSNELGFAVPCVSVADLCKDKDSDPKDALSKELTDIIPQCAIEFYKNVLNSDDKNVEYEEFITKKIVFVYSDPTNVDGDGDGIVDCIKYFDSNEYVQKTDEKSYNVTEFNDPNPLKFEYLWQWPLLDTYGNKVSRIQSGFYEKRKHDSYDDYHSAIDISARDKNNIVHSDYQVVAAYDGILKSVKEISWGGCTIEIEHTINGRKYISRYCHMLYYDNENENHEFVQYINEILEQRDNEETFLKNIWGEGKMAGKIQDVTEFNIYVKAGTPIGIASGTKSSLERDYYGKHLDFRIDDAENKRIINPISFCQSLSASKIDRQEYKCDMLINVPINLYNACEHDDYHKDGTWCDCKDESEGGEAFDIKKLYKIKYNIEMPNIEE